MYHLLEVYIYIFFPGCAVCVRGDGEGIERGPSLNSAVRRVRDNWQKWGRWRQRNAILWSKAAIAIGKPRPQPTGLAASPNSPLVLLRLLLVLSSVQVTPAAIFLSSSSPRFGSSWLHHSNLQSPWFLSLWEYHFRFSSNYSALEDKEDKIPNCWPCLWNPSYWRWRGS
jgi:hypothetical protein